MRPRWSANCCCGQLATRFTLCRRILLRIARWTCSLNARWRSLMHRRADLLQALLAACCWLAIQAGAAETSARLPAPIAEALAQSGIPESSVGIFVQDVQGNRPLIA